MRDISNDWCILRTTPGRTLALAEALADAGYEVWTPSEVRVKRAERSRKRVELVAPILPSFVFARSAHLRDLVTLSHSPALNYRVWDKEQRRFVEKGRPHFKAFRDGAGYGRVSDDSLAGLRAFEARLQLATARRRTAELQRDTPPRFSKGDTVKVQPFFYIGGPFEGLVLTVAEDSGGKLVRVIHPNWSIPLTISAWSLLQIQLEQSEPERALLSGTAR